jgi:diguanylate cyclase (GGDEF)-like protein/PAS domain S-box-containing protein
MPGFSGMSGGWSEECDEVEQQLSLVSLALDAAGDSIIIHRPDGTLVRFNEAAAHQLGVTAEQFAQLPPWGWAQPMSAEARQKRCDSLREQGEIGFIATMTRGDGTQFLHDVHTRWIEAPGGPYIVAVSRDVTDQIRAREVLENLAFHDPLTGLANRALFEDRLELAMASARRHDELLGVAFLDIDDFKDINDGFGHIMGDQVLIAVAQRLESSVRHEDTVARIGGDEFAAIFPRATSIVNLEGLAEKLVARVREPVLIGPATFHVTASVGLGVFEPDDDARSLLMRADIEMYEAKRTSPLSRRAILRRRG